MTVHVRRQAREAVAAILAAAGAATAPAPWEDRVHQGKRWAWQAEQMPGVAVYTDSETVALETMERAQSRNVTVVIELAASPELGGAADSDRALEDLLDAMQQAVEEAVGRANSLGGLALDFALAGVLTGLVSESDRPLAIRRMTWSASLWTVEGAPTVAVTQ